MGKFSSILILLFGITYIGFTQTVSIGAQAWTTKNLDVSMFRSGDTIPKANTKEEWIKAAENKLPACCYYRYNAAYGTEFGMLYNWYAVNDSRGLAPEGYHIPNDNEWTILENSFHGNAGKKMKSTSGWDEAGNGTNSKGFSCMPGGMCLSSGFYGLGVRGNWWSSSESDTKSAWARSLNYDSDKVNRHDQSKEIGYSVRCLRD